MTSPTFNATRAALQAEMAIFDQLPTRLRDLSRQHEVRPSVLRNALLRGVSIDAICNRIEQSVAKHEEESHQ